MLSSHLDWIQFSVLAWKTHYIIKVPGNLHVNRRISDLWFFVHLVCDATQITSYLKIKWYFLPSTGDLRKQTILVFLSAFTNLSSLINLMSQRLLMAFGILFCFAQTLIAVSINSIILELFLKILYSGHIISRKKIKENVYWISQDCHGASVP